MIFGDIWQNLFDYIYLMKTMFSTDTGAAGVYEMMYYYVTVTYKHL